jgi:hypothetical protein
VGVNPPGKAELGKNTNSRRNRKKKQTTRKNVKSENKT